MFAEHRDDCQHGAPCPVAEPDSLHTHSFPRLFSPAHPDCPLDTHYSGQHSCASFWHVHQTRPAAPTTKDFSFAAIQAREHTLADEWMVLNVDSSLVSLIKAVIAGRKLRLLTDTNLTTFII